jgi:hypothetical protein
MTEYPKFSDFAKGESKLDGEKVKLKDILNQEILVIGHAIHRSISVFTTLLRML